MRIKLIQSNQSEMVSYFHENLNKRIGAVAQTVYTDVYNCRRRRLPFRSSPPKTSAAKKPLLLGGTGHQSQDPQFHAKGTPDGLEMCTIMQILTPPEKGHILLLLLVWANQNFWFHIFEIQFFFSENKNTRVSPANGRD